MRTPIACCLATAIAILVPASAFGIPVHHHVIKTTVAGGDPFTAQLVEVINVAPRDSDQDGIANRRDPCPHAAGPGGCPPAPPAMDSPVFVAEAPAPVSVASTSAGGCVGMEAESGSTGYATNTGNGYIGCYQISADHFAAGGSCAGLGTDPAGQDACAANICATEGAGAWTNPAGQNPCGRLGG